MNEDRCSGRKTRTTDSAEAQKKPPVGLGDQPRSRWEGAVGGNEVQHGPGVSSSGLGAGWHSPLSQQESGVGDSFGGRHEGVVGKAPLCRGGHLHVGVSDVELLRGQMNAPVGRRKPHRHNRISSGLRYPSGRTQNPSSP